MNDHLYHSTWRWACTISNHFHFHIFMCSKSRYIFQNKRHRHRNKRQTRPQLMAGHKLQCPVFFFFTPKQEKGDTLFNWVRPPFPCSFPSLLLFPHSTCFFFGISEIIFAHHFHFLYRRDILM